MNCPTADQDESRARAFMLARRQLPPAPWPTSGWSPNSESRCDLARWVKAIVVRTSGVGPRTAGPPRHSRDHCRAWTDESQAVVLAGAPASWSSTSRLYDASDSSASSRSAARMKSSVDQRPAAGGHRFPSRANRPDFWAVAHARSGIECSFPRSFLDTHRVTVYPRRAGDAAA
jgi:hypothetical protein